MVEIVAVKSKRSYVGRIFAGLIGTAVLAGCGVTPPRPVPPPTSPTPSLSSTPSASLSPSPSASPRQTPDVSAATELTATGTVPRILDAGLISDAMKGVESRSDTTRHFFANWPLFGLERVDAVIADYYTDAIEQFSTDYPTSPDINALPELNLGWHLVASSPRAVAIVADGYEFAGASTQERWRTFWFDPVRDAPLAAGDLVDTAATNRELATSARRPDAPGLDLSAVGADPVTSATLLAFAEDGSLLVGYDACEVAACAAGRVTFAIAPEATEWLLTDAGRAARSATLTPRDPIAEDPGDLPNPSPSTASTPSSAPAVDETVDCRKSKCVALTFDDGPGPFTTKLLDHLRKADVPATFFMLGQQVELYPKITRAVAAAGHEIGVHTWDHRMLTRLDTQQVRREITSSIKVVKQVTGKRPRLLRPPYGATDRAVAAEAKRAKVAQVLWDVDTLDWKTRSAKKTIKATLKDTRRGSIVLLHDIHSTTVAAVPGIIEGLRAKGYTFVTVSQLLGKAKPGRVYSRA